MIKNKLLRLSRSLFDQVGLSLTKGCHYTDDAALMRLKARGVEINTVIDVGASDGRWSDRCMVHYPDAKYLLIEAQSVHNGSLEHFTSSRPNAQYVICAAGNNDGQIFFDNDDPLSGAASFEEVKNGTIVDMFMIDTLVEKHQLKPPFLIKLDTHGFEVPILEGCSSIWNSVNVFAIEAYNYRINENALKFFELCAYMDERGYSTVDMSGIGSRKYDSSLWQMDLYFRPSKSKEFDYLGYQ
jgi:FkbM family methyltransferase